VAKFAPDDFIQLKIVPVRVVLPTVMELARNGVTAKKRYPKNTSQKCNRTPSERYLLIIQTLV
jgi:hypothetical protein